MDVPALHEYPTWPEDAQELCQQAIGCELQINVEGRRLGPETLHAGVDMLHIHAEPYVHAILPASHFQLV